MGKYNLQTSKKRVSASDDSTGSVVETPIDEVSTGLQKLSDHLAANLTRYAIGIFVLLVTGALLSWWWTSRATKAADNTQKLFGPVEAVLGTVRTTAASEPTLVTPAEGKKAAEPKFETDEAKWAAAADALGKVKAEIDGPRAALATALQGRIEFGQKKYAEASKSFGEAAGVEDIASLAPVLLESQGDAAWAAGDIAGAAGHFTKLAGQPDLYHKVRGNMLLGDLYAAGAGKDAQKATGYYDAALEALKPAEGQVLTPDLRSLRGEIARRKAQVQP